MELYLVRREGKYGYMVALGRNAEAKKELSALRKDLVARGVNEPILDEIKTYEGSL